MFQPLLKTFIFSETVIQRLYLLLCNVLDILLLDPTGGLEYANCRPRVTQMAGLIRSAGTSFSLLFLVFGTVVIL